MAAAVVGLDMKILDWVLLLLLRLGTFLVVAGYKLVVEPFQVGYSLAAVAVALGLEDTRQEYTLT